MREGWSRILVGIDLGPMSETVAAFASRLARDLGARLDLVYIHQIAVSAVPEIMLHPPDPSLGLAAAEQQLRLLAEQACEDVPADYHVRAGAPVSGIQELIAELTPDLLVVGSHGRSGVMRVLLGSVAEQLCRSSPIPVLVVPSRERAA